MANTTLTARSPRWPLRLKWLVEQLGAAGDESTKREVRNEALSLLYYAISSYVVRHAARFPRVDQKALQDVVGQKALTLIRRAETGSWNVSGRQGPEIMAFLSKVAQSGIVDELREKAKRVVQTDPKLPEWDVQRDKESETAAAESPDLRVERKEFAQAVRSCAGKLAERSRTIWFLRVFCSMSSRQIADHPEVRVSAGNVDVIFHRSRNAVRSCLQEQGYAMDDAPPGVFVELWKSFRYDMSLVPHSRGES